MMVHANEHLKLAPQPKMNSTYKKLYTESNDPKKKKNQMIVPSENVYNYFSVVMKTDEQNPYRSPQKQHNIPIYDGRQMNE